MTAAMYEASAATPRRGDGGARTVYSSPWRRSNTGRQLEASPKAPCMRRIVGLGMPQTLHLRVPDSHPSLALVSCTCPARARAPGVSPGRLHLSRQGTRPGLATGAISVAEEKH